MIVLMKLAEVIVSCLHKYISNEW